MPTRRFTCYILRYVTHNRVHKEYYGVVEILQDQDQKSACDFRLKWHLQKPRVCMDGAVVDSMVIEHLGGPLSERNAYLQEAIYTACALESDSSVRGACYACKNLGTLLVSSAAQVRRVVRHLSGQRARDALKSYIDSTLEADHPLTRHVAGLPYKDAAPRVTVKLRRAFKSGRSGKPGHETRRGQLNQKEYARDSARHRRLKRGKRPGPTVRAEDQRRAKKRKSGLKIRPALH